MTSVLWTLAEISSVAYGFITDFDTAGKLFDIALTEFVRVCGLDLRPCGEGTDFMTNLHIAFELDVCELSLHI